MQAFDAAVISTTVFIVVLSAVYGLLSGYFAARAANLIHLAKKA
jgi:ABC-type dipeptide/oligopeptide/nickel transport system permease subunit